LYKERSLSENKYSCLVECFSRGLLPVVSPCLFMRLSLAARDYGVSIMSEYSSDSTATRFYNRIKRLAQYRFAWCMYTVMYTLSEI